MQKTCQIFIGIDVSKDKLDYCIVNSNFQNPQQFGVVANQAKAISKFIQTIRKNFQRESKILFCLENTGI